jgi:hypothetical protein
MNKSESIVKLAGALVKAQAKIEGASKDAANPFFKSSYANLNSVMEACKPHLNAAGISVLQPVISDTDGDYVETILLHESGEFISSRMKLIIAKQDMQAYGSAVSYARRYGLQSMVFVCAEDDDGEKTMNRSAPAKTTAPKEQWSGIKNELAKEENAQLAAVTKLAQTPLPSATPAKSSSFKTATPAKTAPAETPAASKAATNLGW